MRTFREFLESQKNDELLNNFYERLGFKPPHKHDDDFKSNISTMSLRQLPKEKLHHAIRSIGLDDKSVQKLEIWLDENPDTIVQNLANEVLKHSRFGQKNVGLSDDLMKYSTPATFKPTKGDPAYPVAQSANNVPMYGGPPADDGRMT